MANGTPILLAMPEGEATEIIRKNNCGIIALPENSSDIADKILFLKNNPKILQDMKNFNNLAALKYSRKEIADSILETFKLILTKSK